MTYRIALTPFGYHEPLLYAGPSWGFATGFDGHRKYWGGYVHVCPQSFAPSFDMKHANYASRRLRRCGFTGKIDLLPTLSKPTKRKETKK